MPRRILVFSTLTLSLWVAEISHAQVSGSEDDTLFGSLGQLNSGVTFVNSALPAVVSTFQPYSVAVGPNACVPTATANGLAFLNNYQLSIGQPAPLSFGLTYTSVNNLASYMQTFNLTRSGAYTNSGGTYTTYMFNGLQSYVGSGGPNPAPAISISGQVAGGTPASWIQGNYNAGMTIAQNTTLTAQYLAGALNKNFAVELTLEWGTLNGNTWTSAGGGHEVTLDSISLAANGTGTIQFLDPWGSGGSSANLVDATLTLGTDGYLYVTDEVDHSTQTSILDGDNNTLNNPNMTAVGASSADGRIDVDMIEAVPEPGTYAVAGAGLLIFLVARYHRKCHNA